MSFTMPNANYLSSKGGYCKVGQVKSNQSSFLCNTTRQQSKKLLCCAWIYTQTQGGIEVRYCRLVLVLVFGNFFFIPSSIAIAGNSSKGDIWYGPVANACS